MEKSFLLRAGLALSLLLCLAFPVLHILMYVPFTRLTWDPYLGPVLFGATLQALLSSVLTLLLGFLGALGLAQNQVTMATGKFRLLVFALILPSFLPPLLTVSLTVGILGFLPMGLVGVIFFHIFMNVGLVSVLMASTLVNSITRAMRETQVMGVGKWRTVGEVVLPLIRIDLGLLFFYLFVLFFFSFSIPLLVGGSLFGGVEVFIYEKILLYGEWSEAVQYSLFLFLTLFLLAQFFKSPPRPMDMSQPLSAMAFHGIGSRILIVIPLLPVALLTLGLLWSAVSINWELAGLDWLKSARGTFTVGLIVGSGVFVFLSLLSFSFLNRFLSQVLLSFINPGWVLVGFSFLLLGWSGQIANLLLLGIALTLAYVPFLFRLSFSRQIQQLESQVRLAQSFPVSWRRIFLQVIWPQTLAPICFLSGVAGLWACGDFAMSEIILGSSSVSTLAMDIKVLLSTYRLEKALLLLYPLLIVSFTVFFIFQGLAYVSCRNISPRSWTL